MFALIFSVQLSKPQDSERLLVLFVCFEQKSNITKNNGLPAVDSVFPVEPYLYCESSPVVIKVRFGLWWWMIRGSNTGSISQTQ